MRVLYAVLLPLVFTLGCATAPVPLSSDPGLDRFLRTVERQLEEHAWRSIIDSADRSHYRAQVEEHGMPEPQYIAELFGLHRVDNNIKRGDAVDWEDLQRIRSVELHEVTRRGGTDAITGTVVLDDGLQLELNARVERRDDRYVLTGALG